MTKTSRDPGLNFSGMFLVLCCSLVLLTSCAHKTPVPAVTQVASPPKPVPPAWPSYEDPAAQSYIKNCQRQYHAALAEFRSVETQEFSEDYNLLRAINHIDILIYEPLGYANLYSNVHPNAMLRSAAEACEQKMMSLQSDINMSRPLYNRLAAIETAAWSETDRYFVETKKMVFELAGVNLEPDKRARVRELNEAIVKTGQVFAANIRNDVRKVPIQPGDLRGLPEDFIAAHPVDATGMVVLTTDYPDYLPFMQYAINDNARLQMYKAFRQRGYPANREVLKELLRLRHQLAQLLGYANFADYITADKMIGSAQNAAEFIERINVIATPRSNQDYAALLQRLQKIDPLATQVGDWQKTFLENLLKNEEYSVDPQEVRQYFAYADVRQGIFDLVEHLFEVEIRPWQTEVWHVSVEAYEMWDDGKLLGQFYLDMHPREGKYQHAAQFGIRDGVAGIQTPLAALVCNFPGGDGSQGLLEHDQVETFLHEFGHLLHTLFGGNQPWLSLAGTNTQRDFVEAPSQMLEEWVWNAETLKSFARNAAGEPIPDALIARMNAARQFGKGIFTRHQIFYAALSLNYYNRDPDLFDLDELMVELQQEYSPFAYVDDTFLYAGFGHLDGYSAMYYTYMWSLVIASDLFQVFEQAGLRNPQVAQRYRAKILAPGGSKPAAQLVEDFLGRPFSFDAYAETLDANAETLDAYTETLDTP